MMTMMPRILRASDAKEYVGGRLNLARLLAAGWITPIPGKGRAMDYDRIALDRALDRVSVTGWPDGDDVENVASEGQPGKEASHVE